MNKKTIGMIGVGRMGTMMAEYLIKNGYAVLAYDAFPAAIERAKQAGVQVAGSAPEVGQVCDIILLSLPKPAHVREVVQRLAQVSRPCSIVADTSTVDPATSRENAQLLRTVGAAFVDAPILGLPFAVGNWIMPLGGSADAVAQLTPVLMSFCKQVTHAGDVGCGNAIKLLNNTMFAVINALSAEIMQAAAHVGVDQQVFYDTIAQSDAATVSVLFKEVGRRICENRFEQPTFTLDLLLKDVNLGVQMIRSKGMNPVLASAALGLNENACSKGWGAQDCSGIYNYFSDVY